MSPSMSPPTTTEDGHVRVDGLKALLSATLGQEKSAEVVETALHRLGFFGPVLNAEQVAEVLDALSGESGLVGVAARFARSRSQLQRRPARGSSSPSLPPPPHGAPAPAPGFAPADLSLLLAPALGADKSQEVIAVALAQLALPVDILTREQALRLFDHLATIPGLVGVTARFAKARVLLR